MNKKAIIFFGLCAIGPCTWEAQAANHNDVYIINTEDNLPAGYEKIVLQGNLDCNASPDDILAGANENAVYIHFNKSFGNVNISIYNALNNLVYNCVVDTSIQQTIILPISNSSNGTYTVVLSNVSGYIEGDFDHD